MDSDPALGPTVLAAIVMMATAAWALAAQLRSRPRRPGPARATMTLGDEPPAIVDLLTDDFTVTPEAVPATVVDLAARGWLSIEEVAGGNVVVRLSELDRDEPLETYERRVLGHLRHLATGGVVPAAAMTTGPDAASKRWWRSFRREVIADAHRRGLSQARWTRALLFPIWAGIVATGALLWLSKELGDARDEVTRPDLTASLWILVLLGTLGLGFWAFTVLPRDLQRDTDAGLAAAAAWLGVREHMATVGSFVDKPAAMVAIWDRHLAYAVALDLAPTVVAELPLGAEDHRHGWSRATGQWRPIRIRYPWLRPGYGQHPGLAVLGAVVAGAGALVVLRWAHRVREGDVDGLADLTGGAARGVDLAAIVLGALALIMLAWSVAKLALGLLDLVSADVREGVVVRARVRRGWVGLTDRPSTDPDNRPKERFFCALDTGAGPEVIAWRVRRRIFDQVKQGERYRMRVSRGLGYVHGVEPLTG